MHHRRCLSKKDGRLSSRVPPTHYYYFFRVTELSLHMRCVVIDTSARESVCFLDRQSRILRASCDHDAAGIELKARLQYDLIWLSAGIDMHDRLSDHQLRAKFLSLSDGSIRKLLSRKPCGKSQVVFDL